MTIGMTGDVLRGAKAIGMSAPTVLNESCLDEAMAQNPQTKNFDIYVNQFATFMAERMVAYAGLAHRFTVRTDPKYAKDSWRIEPVE